MGAGLILVVIAVVLILYFISINNNLVTLRNGVGNAFAQIDVQLKRRYDLIPNLVETAKGYMKHERETLEAVIQARNSAVTAQQKLASNPKNVESVNEVIGAETQLSQSLTKFMALAESYPDLKANQNMNTLMEELTSTENRVAYSRQAYNDAVYSYNNAREIFPNVLVANMYGFKAASVFEVKNEVEKEPVKVAF